MRKGTWEASKSGKEAKKSRMTCLRLQSAMKRPLQDNRSNNDHSADLLLIPWLGTV